MRAIPFGEVRDWFLPAEVIAPAATEQQRGVQRRAQRLIALLLVMTTASLFSCLIQLSSGIYFAAIGSGSVGLVLLLALGSIKRGANRGLVGFVVLSVGSVVCGAMTVLAGPNGYTSLFWVGLAPTIAMSIGGRRWGWVMFGVAAVVMVTSVLGITGHWFPVIINVGDHEGSHIVSMLAATLTYFFLTHAYEAETSATIAALEQSNRALGEARVVAEAASRAKGEFLATMSHEIRTPMNGVLGMTHVMLGERELPPEVREGLQTIKQSGDTLLAVINDILDFSKIESGQLTLERVSVDLRRELMTTTKLVGDLARSRRNAIVLEVADSVPRYVVGDPVRLRQVALNLVTNAAKFTERGRVEVRARASSTELELTVRDTGIGMSPEAVSRLFKPFQQADPSTTRRFGGTGLGLTIVQRLVAAMRGSIEVESTPNGGSLFTVRLPYEVATAQQVDQPQLEPAPTRRLRLLLAEDNFINQKVATRLLEQLGHTVLAASDGVKALQVLETEAVDLVFMDCHMPEMDGFEATRRIRAMERLHTLPVVALTAASMPEERQRCFDVGMNEVLIKPVRRDELQRLLERLTSLRAKAA